MLVTYSHLHTSLIFADIAGAYSSGRLQALPANIRLVEVTGIDKHSSLLLRYEKHEVPEGYPKRFYITEPWGQHCKTFLVRSLRIFVIS